MDVGDGYLVGVDGVEPVPDEGAVVVAGMQPIQTLGVPPTQAVGRTRSDVRGFGGGLFVAVMSERPFVAVVSVSFPSRLQRLW